MSKEKESFSNIFEAASKQSKTTLSKENVSLEKPVVPPLSNEELKERFNRCKELHNLIQDKIEKAFSDHNITQKALRDYFDRPQHFSAAQWRLIQEQKDEVAKRLKELVPEIRHEKASGTATKEQKKPKSMQTKSRWMPMR